MIIRYQSVKDHLDMSFESSDALSLATLLRRELRCHKSRFEMDIKWMNVVGKHSQRPLADVRDCLATGKHNLLSTTQAHSALTCGYI